jgi:hypothetical protein
MFPWKQDAHNKTGFFCWVHPEATQLEIKMCLVEVEVTDLEANPKEII